ncbi:hypothetical protein QBC38DRAFT_486591 [Podospora fimiseda]|uniref:SMP-30/Gluconolactonase/LRE-like region domain-containing protein n=1 Tax=Podospora fimiseda TaxID=252190 RepID=A0AAN7BIJ3_9PEZI|nr:hypothetical protein QBC38DRAFT_486591 [Podospora fimiseda]
MHSLIFFSLLFPFATPSPITPPKPTLIQLFSFPYSNPLFLENLLLLPDNRLLLSSLGSPNGSLYLLDPHQKPSPQPIIITTFPNTTAQLGIAPLGNHHYAISTCILDNLSFFPNTSAIRIISLAPHSTKATQISVIPVPDTLILNGMISLPKHPEILLIAGSAEGRILRVNTVTKRTEIIIADELFTFGNRTDFPFGINGLRIRERYLYFTNTAKGLFGRFEINEYGDKVGQIEVLYELEGETGLENAFDDFEFDKEGNAYVGLHADRIMRLRKGRKGKWEGEVIIDGGDGDGDGKMRLKGPTAVVVGKGGKELFVTTSGQVDGIREGGQVVRVVL